jgi:hypothetical protein
VDVRLRRWRSEQSSQQKVPAYVVLHNSHIEEISARKPRTTHELGAIKGVGLRRAARYGEEILALVRGEEPEIAGEDSTERESSEAVEKPGGVSGAGKSAGEYGEYGEYHGYHGYIEHAERLLAAGQGSEAVPELARAIQAGGDEARREVDALLSSWLPVDQERSRREATG